MPGLVRKNGTVLLVCAAASALCGWAQTLPSNASLNGRYWVRHVQLTVDGQGTIANARSFSGSLTFDGNGGFTFTGQQNIAVGGPAALSGSGVYTVQASGFATLSNPQQAGAVMNARLGAAGVLAASSTDAQASLYDLLIAIPAGTAVTNGSLSGSYFTASLDFMNASASQARAAFFRMTANGQGSLGNSITVTGQAANVSGGAVQSQTLSGATYALQADGSGTAILTAGAGLTPSAQLVGGVKTIYVSRDGSLFIGGGSGAGSHDLLIGARGFSGQAGNGSVQGLYFGGGLRFDGQGQFNAWAGSASANGQGRMVVSRRVRTSSGTIDFTGLNGYAVNADGSGSGAEIRSLGVGVAGDVLVTSGTGSGAGGGVYELTVAVRAPGLTGSGVFLNPQGVVNAASFAPVGAPLSAGSFCTLFGTGLAGGPAVATALPFPQVLNGVEVLMNGVRAPIYAVSATQISALVPAGISGASVAIQVNNNGTRSNTVTVPVGRTSPGIFTVPPGGVGAGAILRADFTLVSPGSPARLGDAVQIFLTGLGAVDPPVADGAAAASNPLSRTVQPVNVYVGGQRAQVLYSGLAPGLAGLYQVNIVIPRTAPTGQSVALAIETVDGFHDQVDIALVP